MSDNVRSERKGKERKDTRNMLMEQAARMYRAPDAEGARQRLSAWSHTWRIPAPRTVATLERDVEHTLVFYPRDTVARAWIRPTSFLERTTREFRRTCRQAVTFGSVAGVHAPVSLHVQRLHACWTNVNWWDVSSDLSFSLSGPHP